MKKKYKLILSISAIALVLSIFIGASYALWTYDHIQEDDNVVKTDCFTLTFEDANDIDLNNAYPMSDEEANELTPYHFSITNTCKYTADYEISLETLNTTTLGSEYVKVRLNDDLPLIFENVALNENKTISTALESRLFDSGSLVKDEVKTYDLRIYLDEDAPAEYSAEKKFEAKVVVNAALNKNNHAITLNVNNGTSQGRLLTRLGKTLGTLPTPTSNDENLAFVGWYSDSEFTNAVTNDTVVTAELTNLYAKFAIFVNQNGYNYWNDNYSGTKYVDGTVPSVVYPNYNTYVTNNEPAFVKETYENGEPKYGNVCLNYNNIVYCIEGNIAYDTVYNTGNTTLDQAMEQIFGEAPTCEWANMERTCNFGEYYCKVDSEGGAACGNATKKCYTYWDNDAQNTAIICTNE
ncbi:MAG: InlB B-repeat-containing protein [Bacilli bacterium]|nr:InlB B-repeat-containing protein [Bacilli bacterium]